MIKIIEGCNDIRLSASGISNSFALNDVCWILKKDFPNTLIMVIEVWFHGDQIADVKKTINKYNNDKTIILCRSFISYDDHKNIDSYTDEEIESIFNHQESMVKNIGFVALPEDVTHLAFSKSYIYPNNKYAEYLINYKG